MSGRSPLWGDLAPGPDRVGFRAIFRFDLSRTWKKTRNHAGQFSPDAAGRPIQINVWYPARIDGTCDLMTFGKYMVWKGHKISPRYGV